MSTYRDDPPAFGDASAAEQINKLIREAIGVKALLAGSVSAVKRVDAAVGTHLTQDLQKVDQKFLNLMNESRSSATTLRGVIDDLVDVTLPYSRQTQFAIAKRVKRVKAMTSDAEATAKKHSAPCDARLAELAREIDSLIENLTKTSKEVNEVADKQLKEIDAEITALAAEIKNNTEIKKNMGENSLKLIKDLVGGSFSDVLGTVTGSAKPSAAKQTKPSAQPSSTKPGVRASSAKSTGLAATGSGSILDTALSVGLSFVPQPLAAFANIATKLGPIADFFKQPSDDNTYDQKQLDDKVAELAALKKEARAKLADIDAAIQDAAKVATGFSGLNGKFGNFNSVWTKVLQDFNELADFMASDHYDDQALVARINSESEVYTGLKRALDDYAIRVTA